MQDTDVDKPTILFRFGIYYDGKFFMAKAPGACLSFLSGYLTSLLAILVVIALFPRDQNNNFWYSGQFHKHFTNAMDIRGCSVSDKKVNWTE
jgi:hypothetical protein